MKAFRKLTGLFLIMVLLAGITACGSSQTNDTSGAESQTAESATVSLSDSEEGEASTSAETEVESESIADGSESTADESGQMKILVAYFSATGKTKPIAETIAELTGGDLFEIVPADPYTDDDLNYSNDDCRANQEQNDDSARPEISGTVENMDDYDIVILGHPIWWGEEPRIMDTFMESYDFSDKTVVNFCTSGGSGISTAADNLKALSPDATWLSGHRFETGADEDTVQMWLEELGIFNGNEAD